MKEAQPTKHASMKDELLEFVSTLTPSQVEKLLSHFAELSSLLQESSRPFPLEQTSQSQ
jgi:hypothetical protein